MIKPLIKLLKIASEFKFWMLFASLMGFLTIGSNIGLMMTSAYIISKAALHPSIAELQVAIVGVRFFGISRGIFRYFERLISHEVTFNLLSKFRIWFFRILEPLSTSKISYFKSGDLLKRVVSDIENFKYFYIRIIAPPIVALMVLILFFLLFGIFSFYYSFIISFFFLFGGLVTPYLVYKMSKKYGSEILEIQKRLTEYSIDQTQGITELLVFGQSKKYQKEFSTLNIQYINLQRKQALVNALSSSFIGLLMNLAVVSVLVIAIPNVTSGLLDGVYLSVLTLGTMAIFEAVIPLPELAQQIDGSSKSAENLFSLEGSDNKNPTGAKAQKEINNFSININSLDFSYNQDEEILKNVSLEIPPNKVTAIVGASGAGKSTLIKVLLKFLDHQNGEIFIGEENIQNISDEKLNTYFSILPQSNHLFNLSVKENIRFANLEATDDEIVTASKKAEIHNFVITLPNKYNELIGEQGLKISGGERQRIAIARTLLKDSPIMIFDEPTSNLDSINESKILDMIFNLQINKTVLLITHRLIHLDKAVKIYVFHDGKIIESGTHSELINLNGYYKKMYNTQQNLLD